MLFPALWRPCKGVLKMSVLLSCSFGESDPLTKIISEFGLDRIHEHTGLGQNSMKGKVTKTINAWYTKPGFNAASRNHRSENATAGQSFLFLTHVRMKFCPNNLSSVREDISENVKDHYNIGVKPIGFSPIMEIVNVCLKLYTHNRKRYGWISGKCWNAKITLTSPSSIPSLPAL